MAAKGEKRLLSERSIEAGVASECSTRARPVRSVTVNATESPLGWLLARGLVTQRQYDAGERLRNPDQLRHLPAPLRDHARL